METYSTTDIIKTLGQKQIILFSLADFSRLFHITNQQTLYKKIQRLEAKNIIQKLIKGRYRFLLASINDFTLANWLYRPSYISLESALSFYGIITGFPYDITSITFKKSKRLDIEGKQFSFSQIAHHLFWGYEKKDNFLIADKEKALLDYVYFSLKGLKNLHFDDMELSEIDKQKLAVYAVKFHHKKLTETIRQNIL